MNQDIVNAIKAYEMALNASDTVAALDLYGEDPVFMPQYSGALSGREAVKAGYDHVFNTLKLNVTFTVHEAVEMGDLAYVRTTSAGKTEILSKKTTVKKVTMSSSFFGRSTESGKSIVIFSPQLTLQKRSDGAQTPALLHCRRRGA